MIATRTDVSFSGQFDLVLRELEDLNARLAQLEAADDGAKLFAGLQERLHAMVAALADLGSDVRDERAGFTAALERERERYRELFAFAPAAYVTTDARGVIEEANAVAAELLGVSATYLVGKPLAGFVSVEQRQAFRALLRRLRRGDDAREHELSFIGRNGNAFAAALAVGPVYTHEGVGALRWLIRDVTERARAVEEVQRLNAELEDRVRERTLEGETQRAQLAAVIEQMPAGVLIVEADGTLVRANQQAELIWGGPLEVRRRERTAPGRGFDLEGRALTPDEWPLTRATAAGEVVTGQLVSIQRADGTRVVAEMSAAPVRGPDGRVVAGVGILWDVTARERLERAEREFVANAAHELQTPLTAITSAAEVLQAGAKEIPVDRDRFLEHIQRECDRLARLVRALLVLARAQTSAELVHAEPVLIRDVLRDTAARLRAPSEVRFEVRCSPRLRALADRGLLEQAIENVVSNALKHTSAGTVALTGRKLDRERVAIEIWDTGVGIPAVERDRVFERFYRGGSRDRSGFGLGLAIVEQAMQALGGQVELETAPDAGTRVRLTLRAAGTA
jgi:NtrC-family two-component system sensor histidine kinase KinB